MSKCAVHMQKMKTSALGGMQSHNQREHESKKNKTIDYTKTYLNYDLISKQPVNYYGEVKDRIKQLDLKRAVRKDAVTYTSFIVSSDKEFFLKLAESEHVRRESERESVMYGLEEPLPFEYMPEKYKDDCIKQGSMEFFKDSADFFRQRYGEVNVINATIHLDEATPHMHLGLVPVTKDGRLSAKNLFTPLELKQLQTDYAEKVGKRYGLERGTVGSKATHLDELTFKLQKQQERLEKTEEMERESKYQHFSAKSKAEDCQKRVETLSEEVSRLTMIKSTIEDEITVLEGKLNALKRSQVLAMEKFVNSPQVKPIFKEFLKKLLEQVKQKKEQSQIKPPVKTRSDRDER